MILLDTPLSDDVDTLDTFYPLECNEFDRETGKRMSIRDSLHFALCDFKVPKDDHPKFGPLKSHEERTAAAYLVCELIIEKSLRDDLKEAYVYFDESEPALLFYHASIHTL